MEKTPLYERHVALGAKIIDFGGWAMPVQYSSVIDEHLQTRNQAGLFDICHMGEIEVQGKESFDFLQFALSRNLADQHPGQMKLCLLLNERGGIMDDLTVYFLEEGHYRLVTNAVTKDKDLHWLQEIKRMNGFDAVTITDLSAEIGKIDLQGPRAEEILQRVVPDPLASLRFYHARNTVVSLAPAVVSRSGYTGEDGFEIYAATDKIGEIWDTILDIGASRGLKPAGLGARDTLRLEAGMMLYGNELDETVDPYEVVYGWVTDLGKNFIGREALAERHAKRPKRKLVGFFMEERGIARHGYPVFNNGREIGRVTSGSYGPTLGKAIGLAFVSPDCSAPGTAIDVRIRDRWAAARVTTLPFYKRKK